MKKSKTTSVIFRKNKKDIILKCRIASSPFEKMKGLMNIESLKSNEGMIFCFKVPWLRSFWMKNVKIPLDIIFVNSRFEIIKIYEAEVETGFFNRLYWSGSFCKYVIECNKGFCKKHGIKEKDKLEIKKI